MRKIAFLAVLGMVGSAHAILIDDFTTGPDSQSVKSGTNFFQENGSMLGGDRVIQLEVIDNPLNVSLAVDISNGFNSISEGPKLTSQPGVGWGYTAPSQNTYGTFDLNADFSGQDHFALSFDNNEHAMSGTVLINDTYNQSANFNVTDSQNPFEVDVNFAAFSGSVDWSHVHQIAVVFSDPAANDFTMTKVEAVPEPASMAALAIGAAALLRRRAKK